MEKPLIADYQPSPQDLEADKNYFWCACGKSANQPFCDGSHQGTSFQPVKFSESEAGRKFLCMCKHTKNSPYCDGSHKDL